MRQRLFRRTSGTFGQTEEVIDPRFIFLVVVLSIVVSVSFVRDKLRGTTIPHRVTWGMWAREGVLALAIEVQQHVDSASLMTLALGLTPMVVFDASFINHGRMGKNDWTDIAWGAVSLGAFGFWTVIHHPTAAPAALVIADLIAGLSTLRKSRRSPISETPKVFILGALSTGIATFTRKRLTTAGALFSGVIRLTDVLLSVVISTRWGPRLADRQIRRVAIG